MSRLLDLIKKDVDIVTIYIISTSYTILFANSIRHYYRQHFPNITCKVRREYSEDIHNLIANNNDNYRVLFLGFTHLSFDKTLYDINNIRRKYGLIQIEQLNQSAYPYQSIDPNEERLIENAIFTLDYSFANLLYYPDSVKNRIQHLDIFSIFDKYHRIYISDILQPETRDIDILFIGTMNARRQTILDLLQDKFDKNIIIHVVTTLFGDDLVQLLQRTKIVINLHYYEDAILEVFRIFDIMQNSRCHIISERPDLDCEEYLVKRLQHKVDFIDTINIENIDKGIEKMYNIMTNILSL